MRTVNIKELKARLSAYLREVTRGEVFLVTDRGEVIAKLSRADAERGEAGERSGSLMKLAGMGARLPLRDRKPTDYRRSGPPSGLSTQEIDALLEDIRSER